MQFCSFESLHYQQLTTGCHSLPSLVDRGDLVRLQLLDSTSVDLEIQYDNMTDIVTDWFSLLYCLVMKKAHVMIAYFTVPHMALKDLFCLIECAW